MPTSSRYYKFWIWNQSGAAWSEFNTFMSLSFSDGLNMVPQMSVTVFTRSTLQQSLLVAGAFYRITKTDSTTGNNGTRVQTGFLGEPSSDEKSVPPGSTAPIQYALRGTGMADKVTTMVFDNSIDDPDHPGARITPIITDDSAAIISDIVANINARTPSTIATGTLDTGPMVSVKFRQDNAYGSMVDLAFVGDTTDKFTYYVVITPLLASGVYIPVVNFLKPSNTSFSQPNGASGFKVTNPITASDPLRIIDDPGETRTINNTGENDRIRNAVNVKYTGIGTGSSSNTGQQQTDYATDATSITKYGRRESNIYAPWIQDVTTANTHRGTVLDMFRGFNKYTSQYEGVHTATAVMRRGELYSSEFNANLGDVVALRRSGTVLIVGVLYMFSYDQDTESLEYTIGLPRMQVIEQLSNQNRQLRNNYNAMEQTNFNGQSRAAPVANRGILSSGTGSAVFYGEVNDGSGSVGGFGHTFTLASNTLATAKIPVTPVTVGSFGGGPTAGSAQSGGYAIFIQLSGISATIDGSGTYGNIDFLPEPLLVEVQANTASSTATLCDFVIPADIMCRADGSIYPGTNGSVAESYSFDYPFAISSVDMNITTVTVQVTRKTFNTRSGQAQTGNPSIGPWPGVRLYMSVEIDAVPLVSITLDHIHFM